MHFEISKISPKTLKYANLIARIVAQGWQGSAQAYGYAARLLYCSGYATDCAIGISSDDW